MNMPLVYLFRKMWQYAKNDCESNRRRVVLYSAMSAIANLVAAANPLVFGLFFNAIQTDGVTRENLPHLFLFLLLLLLLEVLFWSLHGPSRVLEAKNAFFVRANYKNYLLKGTVALPIEWHVNHHSGDTIDKIGKGTEALFQFSERTFIIFQTAIRLVTSFGVLVYFDVWAGIIALLLSLATFYVLTLFDRVLVPGYKRVNLMENTTAAKIFDILSNITTVIILRVDRLVLHAIDTFIQKPFQQFTTNTKVNEWKWFTAYFLGQITVIAVIGLYLFSHAETGGILIGTIYILYVYAKQVQDTFNTFAYLYNDIIRDRTSISNAEDLSADFRTDAPAESERLPANWQAIAIKNLSFSYHVTDGADPHIDDVSMTIRKGERVALIGESGGGKSTLLKLMRELYRPKTVSLSVDGEHVVLGFTSISESISLIPQDPEIFATTIRENITLDVDYTDERIKIFTDMACFTNVVERLPRGLESSIVEKGVDLSGGEKQRLALARGLLASVDKDIILLDEPTSSVDFKNELTIYENIFSAFPGKTLISSIHRLHLLSLFDTVYFLKNGKIIASGSFNELKNSSPEFQELWEKYIRARDAQSG